MRCKIAIPGVLVLLFFSVSFCNCFPSFPFFRSKQIAMNNNEQTFIMIKPDGVSRGLVGGILKRFEQRGYKLIAAKMLAPSKDLLEKHYEALSDKKFFPGLITYMSSGPVFAFVLEGRGAVQVCRDMLGKTNPMDSAAGSIRGDFALDIGRNVCHGSDSVESAKREIGLWFPEGVITYTRAYDTNIYE